MKATGIVRRIDDLGRVVIPREIRRTMRWREGDPIEIFLNHDGEVILKKYSPIACLGDFAKEYTDSLHESLEMTVLVTDTDNVLAVSGASKKDYLDHMIGKITSQAIESRLPKLDVYASGVKPQEVEFVKDKITYCYGSVIAPIVWEGEVSGSVIVFCMDEGRFSPNGIMERKMAETAAAFLAKQLQN